MCKEGVVGSGFLKIYTLCKLFSWLSCQTLPKLEQILHEFFTRPYSKRHNYDRDVENVVVPYIHPSINQYHHSDANVKNKDLG